MNEPRTLGRFFLQRCRETPDARALGWIEAGEVRSITFSEYRSLVEQVSLALAKHGLAVGDRVAILAATCKEWHFIDIASMCGRAVVVPIYPSYLPHEVVYLLNHSESKVLVVENDAQMDKIIPHLEELPGLQIIISLNELNEDTKKRIRNHIPLTTYKELLREGIDEVRANPDQFEANIKQQSGEETASIIYTSGTTGEPKGALITQSAFTTMLLNIQGFIKGALSSTDRSLVFLPLSHVLGRCDSLLPLAFGSEAVYAESIDKVVENIALVRPTIMIAVPRIFEKIYSKINAQIDAGPYWKKEAFHLAIKAAEAYFAKIDEDRSPNGFELIAYKAAYETVFKQIYQKFGGRIRYFVSGGAPLAPEIIKFLRYANLTVLEGYGLTETIAPCAVNPLIRQMPGTVGRPLGDVSFRFADDGEILIHTQAMFREYYKNPQATKEAFTADGWFKSGDIGEFNPQGYLRITDRKKDLIKTSGGKFVAPQKLENMLKARKWISHVVIVGEKHKFITALIGIEKERFLPVLDQLGMSSDCSVADLVQNPQVKEWIQADIDAVNQDLAQYESIKKFSLVPEEFTTANFLTPSLKVKRKVVMEKYNGQIEAMYR